MNLSTAGAAFLRHHEGFVDHWYLDPVNVPTIGIGFTWASAAFRAWWEKNRPGQKFAKGARMTREEADAVLRLLVAEEYGKAVNDFLGGQKVGQAVYDGTISPVFNLGPAALGWKWAAALKKGDIPLAAKLLRTTGTKAEGRVLQGLINRRREEAELIAFGDYTVGKVYAEPIITDAMSDGILQRRERGAAVVDLQKTLAARKHYNGTVDGIFGYGTQAAVLAFQRAAGLKADGIAGPKTLAALQKGAKAASTAPAAATADPAPPMAPFPPTPIETPKEAAVQVWKPDDDKPTLWGRLTNALGQKLVRTTMVNYALVAVGGFLIAKGWITADVWDMLDDDIAGVITAVLGGLGGLAILRGALKGINEAGKDKLQVDGVRVQIPPEQKPAAERLIDRLVAGRLPGGQ